MCFGDPESLTLAWGLVQTNPAVAMAAFDLH